MNILTSRPSLGNADLPAMVELLLERRAAGKMVLWPTAADLRIVFSEPSLVQELEAHLWYRGGNLVGFALLDRHYSTLGIFPDPREADHIVAEQALNWGLERMRAAGRQANEPIRLRVRPLRNDKELMALLKRHGFARDERNAICMARSLREPIPAPQLPSGFVIRPVAGEQEIGAFLSLHYDAFGARYKSTEYRQAFMREPDYIPALDLVAVAPDGTFASLCVCSIDREEHERTGHAVGWTDPIGTRPQFRRLGLARALILEGFQRLKDHGVETVMLGTGSDNTAAIRIYESLGYRTIHTILSYSREVLP